MSKNLESSKHWKGSLKIVFCLLSIWFIVSFGCGILAKDWLDQFKIGNAPLGFWMAQQGSILCFVALLIAYFLLMGKLDKKYGYSQSSK